MALWIPILLLAIVTITRTKSQVQFPSGCSFETTVSDGKRTTCTNVTTFFFQNIPIDLNRSQWLTCKSCNLSILNRDSFAFQRNDIAYLVLVRNQITALEDHAFTKFTALKMLKLSDNSISKIEKRTFSKLKRLLQLDLSKNRLRQLEDNVFLELENLDLLNLNENWLERLDNSVLTGLFNLKYLYMKHNRLARLEADTFWHVPNLKMLYLENNYIEQIHPLAFRKLEHLNYLYLNNNSIGYLVQYNFKPLINLVDLQLRFNELTEIQTSTFNGLKSLQYLYLGQNHLKLIHPYGLIGMNALQVLDLIGNDFDYVTLDYFRDLEHLSTLWLENNVISNLTITRGADVLQFLRVLDLIENKLRSFDYKLLHGKMPRLSEVWVGDNPWTCRFAIEMYDYFQNFNVSLCTSTNCTMGATEVYIQNICRDVPDDDDQPDEEINTDFSTHNGVDRRSRNSILSLPIFYLILRISLVSTSF